MQKFWLIILLVNIVSFSHAEVITVAPEYEERYKSLLAELRCLVCQNQALSDSNSELANDLRVEVKEMLEQGASDQDIITFMSDRYGDFVLYRPPLRPRTLLLWIGPFVLLIGGVIVAIMMIRSRAQAQPAEALSEQDKKRLQQVLNKDDQED